MSQSYLEAVRAENQTVNRLFTLLGARLVSAADGAAVIAAPVSPGFSQGGGMVAGGVMAALVDEAMAHAVLSALPEDKACVTAEMNIRYLRGLAPDQGGELRAEAGIVRRGNTLMVAQGSVLDGGGRLLASAGATFCITGARR